MAVHNLYEISNYATYLQQNSRGVEILFNELLIGATSFFRDKEDFEVLGKKAIPRILEIRPASRALRHRVPGCATGEAAYSLVMLFQEYMVKEKMDYPLRIFATDPDKDSIEKVRKGVYPDGIAGDISPLRLKKYFDKENAIYRIRKDILEMVGFSLHDVSRALISEIVASFLNCILFFPRVSGRSGLS